MGLKSAIPVPQPLLALPLFALLLGDPCAAVPNPLLNASASPNGSVPIAGHSCTTYPGQPASKLFKWVDCAQGMMCDGAAYFQGPGGHGRGVVEMREAGLCCTVAGVLGGCHKCAKPDPKGICPQEGSGFVCRMGQTCSGQCANPHFCGGPGCWKGSGSCYVTEDTICSGSCS